VYCGAIAILFLFVIMMTPVNYNLLSGSTLTGTVFPLTLIFTFLFIFVLQPNQLTFVNYFVTNWSLSFIQLSDLETFAVAIYISYPLG